MRSLLHRYRRRLARRTLGQSLTEFALILPVFMILFAAALDLGRLYAAQVTITNAAREGVMEASLNPSSYLANQPCNTSTNRVMCGVLREIQGSMITLSPSDVTMTCNPSCSKSLGYTSTIRVTGHFQLLTPLLAVFTNGTNVTLIASASGPILSAPAAAATTPPTASPSPSPSPSPTATPGSSPTASPSPSPTPTCINLPHASFSVSPNSGKKKLTQFIVTDSSTADAWCPITTWSWSWGDSGAGSSSDLQSPPAHIYQFKGTYTISLVVSNAAGTSDQYTRSVTVTN